MKNVTIGPSVHKSIVLFFLLYLSAILHLLSCKPNSSVVHEISNFEEMSNSLLTSIIYTGDPESTKTFKYNDNGDITFYTTIIDTVTFYYHTDSIVKKYSNVDNQFQASVTYFLNKSNKVDSSIIRSKNDEKISTYLFLYDNLGNLTETYQQVHPTNKNYRQTMIYQNGNLAEVVAYTFDDKPASRYVYEYFVDQKNKFNFFQHHILEDFLGNKRLGNGNQHELRQMCNISMEGDTLSFLRFTYPTPKNSTICIQIEEDVWNEVTTERVYHFYHQKTKK
ncbi:MAG: hypothetical protein WAT79_14950 [Saprospiraceae bacterium]